MKEIIKNNLPTLAFNAFWSLKHIEVLFCKLSAHVTNNYEQYTISFTNNNLKSKG